MFTESRPYAALDSVAAVSTTDDHAAEVDEPDDFAFGNPEPVDIERIDADRINANRVDPTEELQRKIYDLVKTRVLQSIGAGANWTIAFRSAADTDTFFSDTMADMIAWDVAHQLIAPTAPNRARLAS